MSESIRQSQSGFGESLLHLEGKRDKGKAFDEQRRRDNKRSNREAASSSETKRKKSEAVCARKSKLETYCSPEKVAQLCSGEEKCCNGCCLAVRYV